MMSTLEANKRNAIAFYRTAYLGDPAGAVERYVGAEYIQHNPDVGDGKQPFIDYFTEMATQYPGKTIEFVRAVAEGDLVALHTHQVWPGGDEYVTMDFFRFDSNGKIVEHWDAIQVVPPQTKSGNPMY
jgi:predicted SnoaL-like aldol condensation-catalyzing enzyme